MHPSLGIVGPWKLIHLPGVFAFFLGIVLLWTYLEERGEGVPRRLTLARAAQFFIEAAIPTVLTFFLINWIGPLQVRSYGVMMLIGFAASMTWMYLDRARYGFDGPAVLQLGLVAFAGGIVGGRVGSVLLNWSQYAGDPRAALNLWAGGMSWHGGLAGGVLTVVIVATLMRASIGRFCDLAAPGLIVAYAIARVGCFLNGCCFGHPTDLPWGVTFPQIGRHPPPPVPVHPTQLYDIAGSLLLVLPVLLYTTRWLHRPFSRFMMFLVLSSVVRFFVEFARRGATAEPAWLLPALTQAQLISIVVVVVCAVVILVRERRGAGGAAEG